MKPDTDHSIPALSKQLPEQETAAVEGDLEMTKLCAEAMGYHSLLSHPAAELPIPCVDAEGVTCAYDPLHIDAQAMALMKRFKLHPIPDNDREGYWDVFVGKPYSPSVYGSDPDLNRAIVECVAKLEQARTTEGDSR